MTYPQNLNEATSLVSYALDCMSQEDYPETGSFPQFERISTNPPMGFIEAVTADGRTIEIQITLHT